VSFGLLRNSLKVSSGDIILSEEKFPAEFFCGRCNAKKIQLPELFTVCMNCGNELEIKDAYKPSHSNGIYCQECIKAFINDGEVAISLTKIMREVVIKG